MKDELLALAERLADLLDEQADDRRERAIIAEQQRGGAVEDEVVDRWASSFATSYQTLRGIAAALRALRSKAKDHSGENNG